MNGSNLDIQVALLTKVIGKIGEGSTGDPYQPWPPSDDLRPGWGTPKGFESRIFHLALDMCDPRLTSKGIERIGRRMRDYIDQWIREKCRNNENWSCKTPRVWIDSREDRIKAMTVLNFCAEVYVYPPINIEIEGSSP